MWRPTDGLEPDTGSNDGKRPDRGHGGPCHETPPNRIVDEGHMNLKTFLATITLYSKTFVAVTLALLAAGLTLLFLTPTQYVSTAQLLVSIQGSTTATAYQNDGVVTGRVNSYITLLTTDVVSQRVIDKLGLSMTAPATFASGPVKRPAATASR